MVYRAQRIRDPVHNLISFKANQFEDVIWRVIQTRPFQRLRRVKQLGFSDFVYPGATHSRLAHSVGVFHTARQLMEIVHEKVGDAHWNSAQAYAALAAALVHDVGHGPFSHAFEEVGKRLSLKMAHHEHVSDVLIRDSEISGPLKEMGSGFASDVADVIKSAGPRSVYDAVVSSQFDADRLDYIRRDRMMAGSSHGVIDYDWLISNLQVESINTGVDDQKVSEVQTFVIGPKGIHATEAYVLGLFQLYPTIYLHKATRGIEKLFTELIIRVFDLHRNGHSKKIGIDSAHPLLKFVDDPENIERALCLDDTVVFGALSQLCDSPDKTVSDLAKRIRDRDLFRCFDVREYVRKNIKASEDLSETNKRIEKAAIGCIEKIELWKKTSNRSLILKDETSRYPYKRFEESKGPLNQIMVRSDDRGLVDIAEFSPVVASIPRFDVLRYYMNRDEVEGFKSLRNIVDEEIRRV